MWLNLLENITPGMDREISTEFMKILKKQGINFHMQTKVEGIKKNANGASSLNSQIKIKKKLILIVMLFLYLSVENQILIT